MAQSLVRAASEEKLAVFVISLAFAAYANYDYDLKGISSI
jgi:hypothetical protein